MKNFSLQLFIHNFVVFSGMLVFGSLLPPLALAQQVSTQTTTTTSTILTDNPGLGCAACTTLDANFNFPDTSTPIFRGDPVLNTLPSSIANGVPENNQFGVGVPAGRSDFPINYENNASFSDSEFSNTTSEKLESVPITDGNTRHNITSNINQVVPGGTFNFNLNDINGGNSENQDFVILFSIQSMTDPDGNLVGNATGTFTQILDGITTSGTVQFNTTNGFSGTNLHSSDNFLDGRDFFLQ